MALTAREARKVAEQNKYNAECFLYYCTDIGDRWVFHFGSADVADGDPMDVAVNKESGAADYFRIPPIANLDLLENGVSVPVDDYAGVEPEARSA